MNRRDLIYLPGGAIEAERRRAWRQVTWEYWIARLAPWALLAAAIAANAALAWRVFR